MHWFKIETNKGKDGTYHYIGSSGDTFEALAKKAQNGFFVRLDEMLYMDRGVMKEWAEWDKNLNPSVFINPKEIISIMEFKADPRKAADD